MTYKANNKQKQSTKEIQNNVKVGKTNRTLKAPSVTVYYTVRLRIKTEMLTAQKLDRLRLITERDTRICNDYLRIIKHNEEELLQDNGKINKKLLDELTLTTSRRRNGKIRSEVPHDLKKRYPRCSHDEFQECSLTAIWTYETWTALQDLYKKEYIMPLYTKKTPRRQLKGSIGKDRFRLKPNPNNTVSKLWLELRDSLDTKRSGKSHHKKLLLPLAFSPYHEKKLILEKIKTLELVYKSKKQQWWAFFTLQHAVPIYRSTKPPAVLGVDLGIKKTAVAVLLTPSGKVIMDDIRFIVNKERQQKIRRLTHRIKSIQRMLDIRNDNCQPTNQINTKLSQLRRRLRSIKEQELGYAVNQLVNFILQLKKRYNLFVSVGYPKFIQQSQPRGSGTKSLRSWVHKWCYRLFITKLKQKLALYGFDSHRVIAIDESNTSKQCSKCNSFNTTRISQAQFNCHDCGYELNADLNGARNIGKKLIQYSLKPKFGYTRICDKLSGEYHSITLFKCLKPLSQWLEYSSLNTSSL
ncbi:MAG: zinc ribbon domain-containing protein [Candidatus Heimdallarchaeaceae archaeon]